MKAANPLQFKLRSEFILASSLLLFLLSNPVQAQDKFEQLLERKFILKTTIRRFGQILPNRVPDFTRASIRGDRLFLVPVTADGTEKQYGFFEEWKRVE